MKNRLFSVAALAMIATFAACGGGEGEATSETTTSDTVAVPGQDTVSVPAVVPTTDSAVTTTTTTTTTDTMQGQAAAPAEGAAPVVVDTMKKM